jgi:hypothetical protein
MGIYEHARPRCAGRSFAYGADAVVRSSLHGHCRLVQTKRISQIGPHRSEVRAESNRAQHNEGVHVPDREPCTLDVPGELANEIQRPGVLGVRIVLRSPLFPLFAERVISQRRPDRPQARKALGLPLEAGPFEVLTRSAGRRVEDQIELMPVPVMGANEDVPLVVELQRRPDDHQATFTVSS